MISNTRTGLAVAGDGAVPGLYRPLDGWAGEVNQGVGATESLRAVGPRGFSFDHLHHITRAVADFIAPVSKACIRAEMLVASDADIAVPADYIPNATLASA